jgi:hypothetical protein
VAFQYDIGTFRDLETGVDPAWGEPENAKADLGDGSLPGSPINTRLEGPWGIPWWEGLEDPTSPSGLAFTESPNPTYPNESVGAEPLPGAYDGAYRTVGPVQAWGHEPSGGLWGDQALGRIMRFPANIPERYDDQGVWSGDWRDDLAASVAANDAPLVTDGDITTSLLQWPNVWGRY